MGCRRVPNASTRRSCKSPTLSIGFWPHHAGAQREPEVHCSIPTRSIYIRGKASISAFVGGMHGAVLFAIGGLNGLWLPFGVLTFFLNFIPNVRPLYLAVWLPV